MGNSGRRRGKRQRHIPSSLEVVPAGRAKPDAEEDPDHELIHAFPPPLPRHRLKCDHMAFASIDPSQYREEAQCAGMSSAAACIVLELPTVGPPSRKPPTVELMAKNKNRRRFDPVSNREVQRWRNGSQKLCHRFKPVYTHQFFTDEKIQGYRPTDGAIGEALTASRGIWGENDTSHPSFSHHGLVCHTLSIQVRLAPSCRKSIMVVEVGKVAQADSVARGQAIGRQARPQQSKRVTAEKKTEATHAFLRKVSINSSSDVASWDGDDEGDGEEFQLKSDTGRKRKRCTKPKEPRRQKAQERTPALNESRVRYLRSGRKRVQLARPRRRLPLVEADVPFNKSRGSRGKSMPPRQTKRAPHLVTDVSENDTSSPSSDEEADETNAIARGGGKTKRSKKGSLASSSKLDAVKMAVSTITTQVSGGLPYVEAVLLKDESAVEGGSSYKVLSSSARSIADIENDYLDEPFGTVIRKYSREKTSMGARGSGGIPNPAVEKGKASKGKFVLTLTDMRTDKEARQYHDEVEKISQWFIEIASCVEVGMSGGIEADGGYWKVLYLFEEHRWGSATKYSLVGYVTLFYHGLKMTVCQAACLPPYQRAGHGTEMLKAAYEVNESREILVESPAPAFVALRNQVDYGLVSALIERTRIIPKKFSASSQLFDTKDHLPEEVLFNVGSKLNITPRQVSTAYNIWMLGELQKSIRDTLNSLQSVATTNQKIALMEASYKSKVKQALLKTLREAKDETRFDSLGKEEQKEHLEQAFNAAVVRYRSILK